MFRTHTLRLLFFGVLFIVSLFSLLYFALPRGLNPTVATPNQGILGGDGSGAQVPMREGEVDYGTVISVITAVISGLGFLFTTFFAYREDQRAEQIHRLEIEKLKGELVRKGLEIEELKRRLRRDA